MLFLYSSFPHYLHDRSSHHLWWQSKSGTLSTKLTFTQNPTCLFTIILCALSYYSTFSLLRMKRALCLSRFLLAGQLQPSWEAWEAKCKWHLALKFSDKTANDWHEWLMLCGVVKHEQHYCCYVPYYVVSHCLFVPAISSPPQAVTTTCTSIHLRLVSMISINLRMHRSFFCFVLALIPASLQALSMVWRSLPEPGSVRNIKHILHYA